MKSIPLKQTNKINIGTEQEPQPMTTTSLLLVLLNNMPTGPDGKNIGITVEDMMIRSKLRKLIADLPGDASELKLEDADWKHLRENIIPGIRWMIQDDFIIEFVQSLNNAT